MNSPALKKYPASSVSIEPIIRLWLLRLLVLLGAQKKLISRCDFDNIYIAEAVGLIDPADMPEIEFKQIEQRAQLRKLYREAEEELISVRAPEILERNITKLRSLLELSEIDCRVLEFVVILHTESFIQEAISWLGDITIVKGVQIIAAMLGLPESEVRTALNGKSLLVRSGLISLSQESWRGLSGKLLLLTKSFADSMRSSEIEPIELLRERVTLCESPALTINNYNHISETLNILRPYLKHSVDAKRKGVNIFIHGFPGTGKSELAKVLAADIGCDLFAVGSEDEDGAAMQGPSRLRLLSASQNFFAQRKSLLLFDEAEDIFNDDNFSKSSTAQTRKAWINSMLENNKVPVLWISNSISLDPAFIRRFDMVVELPVPPKTHRTQIVQTVCGDMINSASMNRIAEAENLSPAVISRAASVIRCIEGEIDKPKLSSAIELLVSNTLEAQGHRSIKTNDPNRNSDIYDPAFINADSDLIAVTGGLASSKSGRICLYGPPGTGKTAYARWLADQLSIPILVKRGSDLISKWLGETEQNIARAFSEAEREKALLLIDEVDSFLQDRRGAQRSWEITAVNEMLIQMESYSGIFIASTNLMGNLDQAAMRRFDLKVKFDYLNPEQAWNLLVRQSEVLALTTPTKSDQKELSRITVLTPGDFAAVARQHRFRPIVNSAKLVDALKKECGVKEDGKRAPIGFH